MAKPGARRRKMTIRATEETHQVVVTERSDGCVLFRQVGQDGLVISQVVMSGADAPRLRYWLDQLVEAQSHRPARRRGGGESVVLGGE